MENNIEIENQEFSNLEVENKYKYDKIKFNGGINNNEDIFDYDHLLEERGYLKLFTIDNYKDIKELKRILIEEKLNLDCIEDKIDNLDIRSFSDEGKNKKHKKKKNKNTKK